MKYKILVLALTGLMAGKLDAQSWFGLSWSTSAPLGKFADYNKEYSWGGMSLDYRAQVQDNLYVGFTTAVNVFNEKRDFASYTYETITASGTQYRHTTGVPLMATVDYSGPIGERAKWFGGLGIGTTYLYRYTDFGSFTFSRETWQFLLAPEVGVMCPIVEDNLVYLSLRYNANFKNKEMDGQSYLSINLGWAWAWGSGD